MTGPPEETGTVTVRHVTLDTEGICFLCLRTKDDLEDTDSDNLLLLRNFSRYLKLDYGKHFPPSPSKEVNENVPPDAMLICEECSSLSSLFTDLFSALELARLELNECVLNILGVMSSAQEDTERLEEVKRKIECEVTANIFQEMRLEAIKKCKEKITAVPRVQLSKLPKRNRNWTMQRAPCTRGVEVDDFNRFGDPRLPPSCLVKVELELEDVPGSECGSPGYFNDFPDHMDYQDPTPNPDSPPSPLSPHSPIHTGKGRKRRGPGRSSRKKAECTPSSGRSSSKNRSSSRGRPGRKREVSPTEDIPLDSGSGFESDFDDVPYQKRIKRTKSKPSGVKRSLESKLKSKSVRASKSGKAESTQCEYCRWTVPAGGTIRATTKRKLENHLVAYHTEHFFPGVKAPDEKLTLNQFRMLVKHHLFDSFSRTNEIKDKLMTYKPSKKLIECTKCPETFCNNAQASFPLHCIKRHFTLLLNKLKDLQENSKILPELISSSMEKGKECDHCQEFHSSEALCASHEKHFCLQNQDWVSHEKRKRLTAMDLISQSEEQLELEEELSPEIIEKFQNQKRACRFCNCVIISDKSQGTSYNLHMARFHPEEYFQPYLKSTGLDKVQLQVYMRDALFHDWIKEPEEGDLGYSCPSCPREFRGIGGRKKARLDNRAFLLDHILRSHGDIIQEKLNSLQSSSNPCSKETLEIVKQKCKLGAICKYCGEWYTSRRVLCKHEANYCTQNPETFLQRKKVLLYMAKKKVQCSDCFKFFKNDSSLHSHIGGGYCHGPPPEKIGEEERKSVNCSICGKTYAKGTWAAHRIKECTRRVKDISSSVRQRLGRKVPCEDCGKLLNWRLLARHQETACTGYLSSGGDDNQTQTPKEARRTRTTCKDCGNIMLTRLFQRHKRRSCSGVPGRIAKTSGKNRPPGYVTRQKMRTNCPDCGISMYLSLLQRHLENFCHGLYGKDSSRNKTPRHIPGRGRGPDKKPRNKVAPGSRKSRGKDRKPRKRKVSKKKLKKYPEDSPETLEQINLNWGEGPSFQGQQNHNLNLNLGGGGFPEGMEGVGIKDEEIESDSQHTFQSSAASSICESQPDHRESNTAHWSQLNFGNF